MHLSDRHLFALYHDGLSTVMRGKGQGDHVVIADRALARRVLSVLRLSAEDELILFDAKQQVRVFLAGEQPRKTSLAVRLGEHMPLQPLAPAITLAPALLKKEALSECARLATVLGAHHLVPLITEKVQRKWGGEPERKRLASVCIAGAEQSKQFVLPKISEPKQLRTFLSTAATEKNTCKMFLEPDGVPLIEVMQEITKKKPEHIILTCGPEGGFTADDRSILLRAGFRCVALSSTILRSEDAITVSLGALRSCAIRY